MEILFERSDVAPDKPDEHSQTPLSWAVCNGNEDVVKILLGQDDINPSKRDKQGLTPLCWAAERG